jgi:TP901 family phage tail tape measure protein
MPSSTATIALKLETKDFATKANEASTNLLGLQLAAGGAGLAFKGMGTAARSGVGEMALGAVKVDALTTSLGKASKLSGIFGQLSGLAYNTAIATAAISGVAAAAQEFARIPQALNAISASGVSTQTISEFNQMQDAIGGNKEAVEGFVLSAIARLGQFEQAAARSATILKSSTRFDDQGNALRVNARESMQNALSIQTLVNTKLDNAVTSTDALLAQYEVLSGGFSKQVDSEKVLETALKLTQIGGTGGVASNAGDNAKLLGKTLQAYSLSASDAAKTGAILNAVVENGITTIPELSSGFGAASSSAKAAGISMSALGAGVATLTSIGQDTSEALTGFKGLSDAIINKTPEAAAELSKLSLNGQRIRFDTAEVSTKGFTQALIDLYKATGNSPQALAKIFPNQVAYRAAIGLLTRDGAKFASTFEAVNGATA